MIDSVVWAERRRPLREVDRSAKKYFEKTGQLIGTTTPEREASVPSLPGSEIGEATMAIESDPDEKTPGPGTASPLPSRVGNDV